MGYLNYILEQLSDLDGITHRSMIGEYILYFRGKIAPYLCDDRLLVKPVQAARDMMPNARYERPYDGAKEMLLVDNVDDRAFLTNLMEAMYGELPSPRKKK